MQRHHRIYRALASGILALGLLAGATASSRAQTVMGAGKPAECVQNVGNGELACGSGSNAAPGTGATAIGINASASADAAMAFGYNSNAASISAMAFGQNASATNQGSVAVGQGASSTGFASTALGFAARALANETIAIGDTATAQGANAIAIGGNSAAAFPSAVALGFGAQATAANQMMLGTATSIYALPGVNSAASKSALKGSVKMLVVDANGSVGVATIPSCRCPIIPIKKPKTKR